MKNRIEHIDIAKGISITLVALFHSKLVMFIPEITGPMALFRLPLFFFLSGVFFAYADDTKTFLLKKLEALLKPYFSVLLFLLWVAALMGDENLSSELKGIFYGSGHTIKWTPMWFLPHLFSVYCFCYALYKYGKFYNFSPLQKLLTLMTLFVTGVMYIDFFWWSAAFNKPGLPFSIDIVPITATFFIIGHLLKDKIIQLKPNNVVFLLSAVVFILITHFTDASINLNSRTYSVPFFSTIGAVCGIYMVLYVSIFITLVKPIKILFHTLGKASLYILIFHGFIFYKSFKYLNQFTATFINEFQLSIICFIVCILLPLLIKKLVEYSPFLALFFIPFRANKLLQRVIYARP